MVFQNINIEIGSLQVNAIISSATLMQRRSMLTCGFNWDCLISKSCRLFILNSNTRVDSVQAFFTFDISCLLGRTDSSRVAFLILNCSGAGYGLEEKTDTMPAGKESIMSPRSLTRHRDSSAPLKAAWTTSWKATARGTDSAVERVRGEGPRLVEKLCCRGGGGLGGG